MKLGTYGTFDCPTEKIEEAHAFLKEEFDKVGGKVRKVMNPHEFGEYPSFEIDYPKYILEVEDDDEDPTDKDEWNDYANIVEEKYSEKFADYL